MTAALDLFDLLRGFAGPFDGGVVDVGGDEVDQVMRDASSFVERDFGGGNFDLFVDLDRITVDYLAVYFEGAVDAERAFAGGGWTSDGEHARMSITSQMRISSRRAGRIWLREKCIRQDYRICQINKIIM